MYWVLGDIPSEFRSTLSLINLAVLCKADDVKNFGYSRVLEALLSDLKSFEENGLYLPCLGKIIKGTVFSVIADNLGAHALGGLLKILVGHMYADFALGSVPSFRSLKSDQGHSLLEPNSNTNWM